MTGNVCEWCQDWMSNYNSTDQVNPVGPNSGTARVGRGGGWCNSSLKNRVSTRFAGKTSYRDYNSTLENPVGDEKLLDEKSIPSVPLSQKILQSQETQTIKTGIYHIW